MSPSPLRIAPTVLSTALLCACGAPTPVPDEPAKVIYDIPGEPLVTELPARGETGRCTLRSRSWASTQEPTALRFVPRAEPFAHVHNGAAVLTLATSSKRPAELEATSEGVTLRGAVRTGEVSLLPARPMIFAGFVVPTSTARLSLSGTAPDGKLRVRHRLLVGEDSERALSRAVRCADLSLEARTFEPRDALGLTKGSDGLVLDVDRFKLSTQPGGAPAARLNVRRGEPVEVVARAKGYARILWLREDELIFGWVEERTLKEEALGNMRGNHIGEAFGGGSLMLSGIGGAKPTRLACPAELELIAELGGERQEVGHIAASTAFDVYVRTGPFTEVHLLGDDLVIAGEARLLADAKELEGCRATAR